MSRNEHKTTEAFEKSEAFKRKIYRLVEQSAKIRYEYIFVSLAIPYALIMLYLTPPFQVPDEQSHFFRSYMLAEGKLFEDRLQKGSGGSIPSSLVKAWHLSTNDLGIRFKLNQKVDSNSIKKAWALPLDQNDRIVVDVGRNRSPFVYVPQALGIKLGMLFDANPILLLYLGRISCFVFWTVLCFCAIGTTPILKGTFAILALTPMSMFMACSVSHDVVTNCTALLYTAYLFKLAFEAEKFGKREFAILLLFSIVLPFTKHFYYLCLLVLIVPASKFKDKKDYVLKLGSVFFLYFATIKLWKTLKIFYYSKINTRILENIELFHYNVTSNNQKAGSDLAEFATLFFNTVECKAGFYLHSFIARLGWLDTAFPDWYIAFIFILAIAISLLGDEPKTFAVHWKTKAYCLSFFILFFIGAHLNMYLTDGFFSKRGESLILGIQGRYFIPLSILPFLSLYNGNRKWAKFVKYNKVLLILGAIVSMVLSFSILKCRYYI